MFSCYPPEIALDMYMQHQEESYREDFKEHRIVNSIEYVSNSTTIEFGEIIPFLGGLDIDNDELLLEDCPF